MQKWSTGLLNASNWKGCWIGPDSITPDVVMERHSRIAARHLRKQFSISKPVKRATVHVCGLGYYILNINGQRIGDYLLAPLPTAGGAGGEASLYTANLRQAQNTDYFVGNGAPVDLTTEFLWHGFRYIEVTGLKEADVKRIQRQLMTDDLLSTAAISVSGDDDGMLNKILANARRGILSNYKGIPMDCPQRDCSMATSAPCGSMPTT